MIITFVLGVVFLVLTRVFHQHANKYCSPYILHKASVGILKDPKSGETLKDPQKIAALLSLSTITSEKTREDANRYTLWETLSWVSLALSGVFALITLLTI